MSRFRLDSHAYLEPKVVRADDHGLEEGYRRLILPTERGQVETRLYEAADARAATLFVGGVGGGFDSPARGLYPRLCEELAREGISALRVRFRRSTELAEAAHDVLAGLWLLGTRGVERVGLVGHSFGGAVVIAVAAVSPRVSTVVTLAAQSYGADEVHRLMPRPVLFLHGTRDDILPAVCSTRLFHMAGEPKALRLLDGAGHGLHEAAEQVHDLVHGWLVRHLRPEVAREAAPQD